MAEVYTRNPDGSITVNDSATGNFIRFIEPSEAAGMTAHHNNTGPPPGGTTTAEGAASNIPGLGNTVAGAHINAGNIYAHNVQQGLSYLENAYGTGLAFQAPYVSAGLQGLNQFTDRILNGGYDPGAFEFNFDVNDPGFQFLQQRGMDARNAGANAAGLLNSGGRLKELSEFSTGLANTYKTDELNRQLGVYNANTQRLNNLFTQDRALTGIGQNASNVSTNLFTNMGNQGLSAYTGIGTVLGNSVIGAANAIYGANTDQGNLLLRLEEIRRQAEARGDQDTVNAIVSVFSLLGSVFGASSGGGGSTVSGAGGA